MYRFLDSACLLRIIRLNSVFLCFCTRDAEVGLLDVSWEKSDFDELFCFLSPFKLPRRKTNHTEEGTQNDV